MGKKIKDFINATKYKRKYNKIKNNYLEALENKMKDKEKIIDLQNNLLAAKDKITELKAELEQYKRKSK